MLLLLLNPITDLLLLNTVAITVAIMVLLLPFNIKSPKSFIKKSNSPSNTYINHEYFYSQSGGYSTLLNSIPNLSLDISDLS